MKKIILLIFLYFLTPSYVYSIEADVFVQSTVNRASQVLSDDISKKENLTIATLKTHRDS